MIKLWRLTQKENNGYDTFDSMVVAAETELIARMTHPSGKFRPRSPYDVWASRPENVTVEYIGVSDRSFENGEIIVASFNAG
jgi:hypothetical protein